MEDLLKYRIANLVDPTWTDVVRMITRMGKSMFMVKDDTRIVAEFMLDNYQGHAAEIHFSMHPDNPLRYSINVAKAALNTILEMPGIETLYGLTPIENQRALKFNKMVGFKHAMTLPNGFNYMGRVTDVAIMMRCAHGR
jgi:RimJ/RimL family protein N-acetyltransferase